MEYHDRQLTCLDCNQPFVFSAGEQEFFAAKGFREEPKRCKPCRDARKVRKNGTPRRQAPNGHGQASADANIGNRMDGPRSPRGDARRRPGRETFEAVCAQCGAPAQVPFRPTPGRPVFCKDCFGNRATEG